MVRMPEPDYIHYTRLETIYANKAQWLLAVFELRDKEFSDNDTYETQLAEQLKHACSVLFGAFNKQLKPYFDDPDAIGYNDYGIIESYDFSQIRIDFLSFCAWALKLKYNLPDLLVALVNSSDFINESEEHEDQVAVDWQKLDEARKKDEAQATINTPAAEPSDTKVAMKGVETSEAAVAKENNKTNSTSAQQTSQSKPKKGGPKKCTLSLAVELAYLKLLEQGNTKVLMPGMRDAFMECFREMATDGNRNSDKGVVVLIKEVRKSKLGKYTIVTHDRPNRSNPLKTEERSNECDASRVTRFLNSLRTNHPLPT